MSDRDEAPGPHEQPGPRPAPEADEPPLPDGWIRTMKEELDPPGPTPSDAMWREIEARIHSGDPAGRPGARAARPSFARPGGAVPRWGWGLAASVVLLAGIAIGRGIEPTGSTSTAPGPVASESTAGAMDEAPRPRAGVDGRIVRDVAARHLAASETLLGFVAVDLERGAVDDELARRGRRLLADTRMLLRVAPRDEVELRRLLGDLELIFAQLALLDESAFDDARRAEEFGLLEAGLRRVDLVPRIRAAMPMLERSRRPMSSTD